MPPVKRKTERVFASLLLVLLVSEFTLHVPVRGQVTTETMTFAEHTQIGLCSPSETCAFNPTRSERVWIPVGYPDGSEFQMLGSLLRNGDFESGFDHWRSDGKLAISAESPNASNSVLRFWSGSNRTEDGWLYHADPGQLISSLALSTTSPTLYLSVRVFVEEIANLAKANVHVYGLDATGTQRVVVTYVVAGSEDYWSYQNTIVSDVVFRTIVIDPVSQQWNSVMRRDVKTDVDAFFGNNTWSRLSVTHLQVGIEIWSLPGTFSTVRGYIDDVYLEEPIRNLIARDGRISWDGKGASGVVSHDGLYVLRSIPDSDKVGEVYVDTEPPVLGFAFLSTNRLRDGAWISRDEQLLGSETGQPFRIDYGDEIRFYASTSDNTELRETIAEVVEVTLGRTVAIIPLELRGRTSYGSWLATSVGTFALTLRAADVAENIAVLESAAVFVVEWPAEVWGILSALGALIGTSYVSWRFRRKTRSNG